MVWTSMDCTSFLNQAGFRAYLGQKTGSVQAGARMSNLRSPFASCLCPCFPRLTKGSFELHGSIDPDCSYAGRARRDPETHLAILDV